MDDAERLATGAEPLVRVVEAGGGGGDDPDRVGQLQRRDGRAGRARVRAHELAQVGAVDVLHGEEGRVAVGRRRRRPR